MVSINLKIKEIIEIYNFNKNINKNIVYTKCKQYILENKVFERNIIFLKMEIARKKTRIYGVWND